MDKTLDDGKIGTPKWSKQIDRAVKRTAIRLGADMDRMVRDLPEDASPQAALEQVVGELARLQPWFMELIMEDHYFREAYEASVARRPASRPTSRYGQLYR